MMSQLFSRGDERARQKISAMSYVRAHQEKMHMLATSAFVPRTTTAVALPRVDNSLSPVDLLGLTGAALERANFLYARLAGLPVFDFHTHYNVNQMCTNARWATPTALCLGKPAKMLGPNEVNVGFDHYVAQQMMRCGVPHEVIFGAGNVTEQQRFEAMFSSIKRGWGSDVSNWFAMAMRNQFRFEPDLYATSADALWDFLQTQIDGEVTPCELLRRGNVKQALTTDDPTSDLSQHTQSQGPELIPTWRADNALILEHSGRYNFRAWIKKLEACTSTIGCLQEFEAALVKRLQYFKDNGCVAADLGLRNFVALEVPVDAATADAILKKVLHSKEEASPEEQSQWQSYMLHKLLALNSEFGLRQFLHQGPARDTNSQLFDRYGADIGGDGQGECMDRVAFRRLFDRLNSEGKLAPSILFPINKSDFEWALVNATPFQAPHSGPGAKIQLGPPWWWSDTLAGMKEVINLLIRNSCLDGWVGMLSDSRCPVTVRPRTDLFRAATVACVIENPSLNRLKDEELLRILIPICGANAKSWLGA